MPWGVVVSVLVLFVSLSGCASDPVWNDLPESRPLHADVEAYEAPLSALSLKSEMPMEEEANAGTPTGTLTLRGALAAALARNPEFKAASWQVRISEAQLLQAGLRPNPELEFELSEFGGTGGLSGFAVVETIVSLIQPLELGGDREKRLALARQRRQLAGWDYKIRRLEVISETRRRFLTALLAQQEWELAQEAQELTSLSVSDDDEAEQTPVAAPAQVEERLGEIADRFESRRLDQSRWDTRHALSAMWGSQTVSFDRLAAEDFYEIQRIPPLEAMSKHLDTHPRVSRWDAQIERQRAAEELAEAQVIPNAEVRAGALHANETEEVAMEVETTLPLPLFDRRQGDRLAARLEVRRAVQQRYATRSELRQQLREAYTDLKISADELRVLEEDVVRMAREAVNVAERGVEQGQTSWESLRGVRQTLLDVRQRRLETLAAYHRALIEVEGLIARPLATVHMSGDE